MSLIVTESFSSSGSADRPNEDAFGVSSRAAWIIDGATGQGEGTYVAGPGESDASWLAARMNAAFSALSDGASLPFSGAAFFARARETILADFNAQAPRMPEADYAWPSAATARVVLDGQDLCCESLGDCTVLVRFNDGTVAVHGSDPVHIACDAQAIRELVRLREEGIIAQGAEPLAARSVLLPLIRANRNRANEQDGYGYFTLSKPVLPGLVRTSRWPVGDVSSVLLMTDGFYALVEDYHQTTDEALFVEACEDGLETLFRRLRATEDSDPLGTRWPRFKKSDDATAVLLRVSL